MMSSGAASALGFDQGRSMEASFKEFLARPENRKLVEKQQRKEVRQALAAQDRSRVLEFKDRLLEADIDSQANVAPFLRNPVLRRIVQTFANDEAGDFERWAQNPRVIEMLSAADKMMRDGCARREGGLVGFEGGFCAMRLWEVWRGTAQGAMILGRTTMREEDERR